jgi:hypothetical protein
MLVRLPASNGLGKKMGGAAVYVTGLGGGFKIGFPCAVLTILSPILRGIDAKK